jgi:hypothetical protein
MPEFRLTIQPETGISSLDSGCVPIFPIPTMRDNECLVTRLAVLKETENKKAIPDVVRRYIKSKSPFGRRLILFGKGIVVNTGAVCRRCPGGYHC